MNPTPPILSLIQKGTEQFPRYIIGKGDGFRNPVYWNADLNEWTEDEASATTYADIQRLLWDHYALLMESVKDYEKHCYVAPIYLEIYGDKPDLNKLREWLEKAVRIVVNTPEHGDGPDGSVGVVIADFSKTKERR